MTLINELKKRSENVQENDDVKIDLKLYTLAHSIAEQVKPHLKRIIAVLPEFDIHDEKHSEKVISNIESLLGNTIQKLSSYEIFLLYLSAYLHDCAMAPSDYEINVMKLTEGIGEFEASEFSIKNDTKSPIKFAEAINLINENKFHIYKSFDFQEKWIFSNDTEEAFINYLSELLIEYQNFRNGFSKQLKKIDSLKEFQDINDFIRIDYIRSTHHQRAELYVKNLDRQFSKIIGQAAWGKKLANDLAKICRAHGENIGYIDNFEKNTRYFGSETTNLQMIAMMLRLGDITHYSFDRAPVTLLSSKVFKSEYSFHEWMVKQSGANYSIENGMILYSAYCDNPKEYFKLHNYIDWIDSEIQNYFKLQRKWKEVYIENLSEKVNRDGISNDESKFLPKRGIGFSLNQKKILELLKGVGLYKDEYACLRELYQNSLDACRCMIAKNELIEIKKDGNIEFGIEENDEGTHLYCLDNGIGMTKEIIEKYLLNIGNSYYNSSDFFREQARWGGDFTPTSQFGVGILSCFMIGSKIEITTKTDNDGFITCIVNGINDNFYYKTVEKIDQERINNTGTLIKILLTSTSSQKIKHFDIDSIGKSILSKEYNRTWIKDKEGWKGHIYNYINSFLAIVPQNINVKVKTLGNKYLPIISKPLYALENENLLSIDLNKDQDYFVSRIYNLDYENQMPFKVKNLDENVSIYNISISKNGIQYFELFFLPKKHINFISEELYIDNLIIKNTGVSIDGIIVKNIEDNVNLENDFFFTKYLSKKGIINFTGEIRPSISVDRNSIISYSKESEIILKEISIEYIKQLTQIFVKHVTSYNILDDKKDFETICTDILNKIEIGELLFFDELINTEFGDIYYDELNKITNQKHTIKEFINSKILSFSIDKFDNYTLLAQKLLLFKFKSSNIIKVNHNAITIEITKPLDEEIFDITKKYKTTELFFKSDQWEIFDNDYDIVTGLFPFIPEKLYNVLDKKYALTISKNNSNIALLSREINQLFSQSALFIHDKLGLYDGYNDDDTVYEFENKNSFFSFYEIEGNNSATNTKTVLMAYISPSSLTDKQYKELDKYIETDPEYVKGVKEGWSILFTTVYSQNYVIIAGKAKRAQLVAKLNNEFWEEFKEYEFKFTDGTIMYKV